MRRRHKTQVKKKPSGFYITLPQLFFVLFCSYINLHLRFPDSTPVNGESEQKTDDMEIEEKPKSPAHEENNDDTASSPNR